ncbi:ABC transporter substrate-binding protein [Clostridium sp. AM58-1XD]|uniref:ABC transporter substrate-binding protein n=1 Tax=Clostridium sp. AM58-1XD TaxID=2292307 RepID=UPI000E5291B6|nr:ABC transporter substrate-binding protein [Clostridium sp. AM58-1XD]RGY98539.1 ABC transporter substrate-binding protein [Clostridium sp. AM58-1XD]
MKKFSMITIAAALLISLAGCGSSPKNSSSDSTAAVSSSEAVPAEGPEENAESDADPSAAAKDVTIRVGALKGPTSMGLVYMMDQSKAIEGESPYEFSMVTAADELVGKMVKGDLDIALLPANVSSVIYNKTKNVSVIDINTLGVLYMVSADDSVSSIADLKGKTVYLTGMGTTPDYVLRYLLGESGLSESDVTLEYKSEPAEVAAILKDNPQAIGLLPQPFVTAACAQNESLNIIIDMTEAWDSVQEASAGGSLVTGVTIVNNDFLSSHPEAVEQFIAEHEESALYTSDHPDESAELIAAAGIIEKAPIAKKALPYCNITCITGEAMKRALSGYLNVLYQADPASVGGSLPDDSFYYIP